MSGSELLIETLQRIGLESIAALERSHEAREADLTNSRKAIQLSSRAIRAAHRGEFDAAKELSEATRDACPGGAQSGTPRLRGDSGSTVKRSSSRRPLQSRCWIARRFPDLPSWASGIRPG